MRHEARRRQPSLGTGSRRNSNASTTNQTNPDDVSSLETSRHTTSTESQLLDPTSTPTTSRFHRKLRADDPSQRLDDYITISNHLVRCVKRGSHLRDQINHQETHAASHHTSSASLAAACVEPIQQPSRRLKRRGVSFQTCVSFHSATGAPVKASKGSLRVGEGPASRFRVVLGPWTQQTPETLTRLDRVALQLVSPDPEDSDAFLVSAPAPLHGSDIKVVTLAPAAWDDGKGGEFSQSAHLFAAFGWELRPVRADDRVLYDGMHLHLVQPHEQEVFELAASVGPQDLTLRRQRPTKPKLGKAATGPLTVVLKVHGATRLDGPKKQPPPPPAKRKPWLVQAIANLKEQVAKDDQTKQAFDQEMHQNMAAYAATHSLESPRDDVPSEDYYGRKLKHKPKFRLRSNSVMTFVQSLHRIQKNHHRRDELAQELTQSDRLRLMQCYNPRVYGRVGTPAVLPRSSSTIKMLVEGMDKFSHVAPTKIQLRQVQCSETPQ